MFQDPDPQKNYVRNIENINCPNFGEAIIVGQGRLPDLVPTINNKAQNRQYQTKNGSINVKKSNLNVAFD